MKIDRLTSMDGVECDECCGWATVAFDHPIQGGHVRKYLCNRHYSEYVHDNGSGNVSVGNKAKDYREASRGH